MINQEISQLLGEIADALEFKDENRFRVLAYRRGAEALADLDEDVTVLLSEKRLTEVAGIGKGLAQDIAEYLAQHRMTAHEKAMEGIPPRLLGLLKLSGLGPKRLARLHLELGVSDLWTLKDAIDSGRLAAMSGFGAKTAENLLRSVERLAITQERISSRSLVLWYPPCVITPIALFSVQKRMLSAMMSMFGIGARKWLKLML